MSEPIAFSRSNSLSSLQPSPSRSSIPARGTAFAPSPLRWPLKPASIESIVGPPEPPHHFESLLVAPAPISMDDPGVRSKGQPVRLPLPPRTPSAAQKVEKPLVAPASLVQQQASTSRPVPVRLPQPSVPSPSPAPRLRKSASMRAALASILNAPKQKFTSSRFNDPSSVVFQRINEVENRIKYNENPLLIPLPVDPPSRKMQLDRPKPKHFDVPRVPNSDGRIL